MKLRMSGFILSFVPLLVAGSVLAADPTTPAPVAGVRVPLSFTAPGKGSVSLALCDQDGVLVRSLLYAQPMEPGAHTVLWDGTSDMGKPVAAGTYSVKGVFFTSQPAVKPVMFVGKDGNPPWRTADGKGDWGANLGWGTSIVANGKTVIAGFGCVEDNQITGIQQMDGDGNIALRYFSFYAYDWRGAAAMDETSYYLGLFNPGHYQGKAGLEIAVYTIGNPKGKIFCALPAEPKPIQTKGPRFGRLFTTVDGMALTKETLFAAVANNDAIYIIDRATGNLRSTVTVPNPIGLAVAGNRLLVVSGQKVLRLTLDGAMDGVFVNDGFLAAPGAMARDAAGNIYVADTGYVGDLSADDVGNSGSRQVVVFAADGKLLRRIGKKGGSPSEGRFDENGMGLITALGIGPGADGTGEALWVTDIATGFWRTSRWSLDGQFQRQWFSREHKLQCDRINPARPNELLCVFDPFGLSTSAITAYEMDIANKTWRPAWHYKAAWDDMWQEDVYASFRRPTASRITEVKQGKGWPVFLYNSDYFVTFQGRNYFINEHGTGDGAVFTYGPDQKPKAVALVGYHRSLKRGDKIESFYDSGKDSNWFTWADRSGDGRMAMDEITYTVDQPLLAKTMKIVEARLDNNLNVIMTRLVNGRVTVDSILPLKEVLPNGAPVYDWSQLRDLTLRQTPDLGGGDGWKKIVRCRMPVSTERPDGLYSMVFPEYDQTSAADKKNLVLPGVDGRGWWASRNWRSKVAKFDPKTGKCLWAVGQRAPGLAKPGQMYHPSYLAGVEGGAVFVTDTLGPTWVWTQDGLFIGNVLRDSIFALRSAADIQDDQKLYGETQSTIVFTDPKDGRIYLLGNDQAAHIHEVLLPKLTPMIAASVVLEKAQAAKAMAWDPDGVPPTERPTFTAYYGTPNASLGASLDGGGWNRGAGQPKLLGEPVLLDGQELGRVQVLYDATNLYLRYDVFAPHGPINSGSELPYAPFVSGAYVDFYVGPDWSKPRPEVREGDVRVILAQAAGKDFQQGFWQIKKGGTNPQKVVSGAASIDFDQITAVPGLKMMYKTLETDAQTGRIRYRVVASVPLACLGIKDPAGKRIGFDASIGVANQAGDRRERAGHWAGLSEAVVVDRPGSLQLLPDTWGTLVFAPPERP